MPTWRTMPSAAALVALYEATFDERWLAEADRLARSCWPNSSIGGGRLLPDRPRA